MSTNIWERMPLVMGVARARGQQQRVRAIQSQTVHELLVLTNPLKIDTRQTDV
jgi:hypothetical protein